MMIIADLYGDWRHVAMGYKCNTLVFV